MNKFTESDSLANKSCNGRPKITFSAKNRKIIITSKQNRCTTVSEIAAKVNETRENSLSVSIVKRRL